jgi:hypothetical protein
MSAPRRIAWVDANTLIGRGPVGFEPSSSLTCYVPLVIVQELLHRLIDPDRQRAGRALAGLKCLANSPRLDIGMGFGDRVRGCFGVAPTFWPAERRFWSRMVGWAAEGQRPARLHSQWEDRLRRLQTEVGAKFFASLKAKGDMFRTEFGGAVAEEQALRRWLRERDGKPSQKTLDLAWDGRRLMYFLQAAAIAGVHPAGAGLAVSDGLPQPEKGHMRVELGAELNERYVGGLGFGIHMMAMAHDEYVASHGAPDRNDLFDFMMLCSVGDNDEEVLVSAERRWRAAADRLDWSHRVVDAESLD